ncbi:hypothetical protein BpHYR1_025165 [Brachionus plicatilis]|uniref:Uncharacterized protein n=1 Tax=Brachionus plicatilis TaxID=10195 RepID=A0A3M7Q758_BRAPC|nr:hypothetical protein BpHYR1_025165 [Brachionus plicatilis]
MLIELLFKRAELLASIKKIKIEEDSFRNINQSKQSEEGAKSTLQEIATSSKTLKHEDVLQENVGFGLRETQIITFKVDDIPKLYGNDRDKVDEWIYLIETEARTQGIIRTTLKPADVQRGLRSELKSIKLTSNFEDNIMKFQIIANKIDKIDEFEFVWFFLEALDPRFRAELNDNNNNYKQYRNTRKVNMVEEVNNDSDNPKENPEYVYTCDTGNLLYISATKDGITLTMALDSGLNGETEALKLNIEGHVCEIEFLLIDHEDSDGLLGFDWFMRTGASLNPRERSLKFLGEVVYLEVSEKEYCNKVITENLTDENYPDDCFSEDLNNFNEDWPLESLTGKIELKPIDNLDAKWQTLPGIVKKQVKRVESQASHYMYDLKEDLIFYFDKKGCALIVPKPDLRTKIIEKSHFLGHFQKETTVKG